MAENEQGFTLIELLVVLAIMSLAAVLFVSASGSSSGGSVKRDFAKLESAIASARQQAILSAAPQKVTLAKHSLELRPAIGNTSKNLIFYADGSSNGGTVLRGNKPLFSVRWIDGRITK